MTVKRNSHWKLIKSMKIKLHTDWSLRESIKHCRWRMFQKNNLPMMTLMIWMSALFLIMMIVSTKRFFMKLLRWKTKRWKVSSESNICVLKNDYWRDAYVLKRDPHCLNVNRCIHVKHEVNGDCTCMLVIRLRLIFDCKNWNTCIKYHVRINFVLVTWKILITLYTR